MSPRAFTKIKGFIENIKNDNESEIFCGGECEDKEGYFIRPTIAICKNPKAMSMQEEAFGPLLSIYIYPE